jgi:hypothetical protein
MKSKLHFNWKILGVFLLAFALNVDGAETNSSRVVSADVKQIKGPRSMIWRDCVGAGRVAEGLRDGWRRQLEECHREVGFKCIQMHGLMQEELSVYSSGLPAAPFRTDDWPEITEKSARDKACLSPFCTICSGFWLIRNCRREVDSSRIKLCPATATRPDEGFFFRLS